MTLVPGHETFVTIPANENCTLKVEKTHNSTRFMVIQLHSQIEEISLSSSPTFSHSTTKTGSSAGLVTMVSNGNHSIVWYVSANSTENVTALAHVELYTVDDPLPGGCNQVFNMELDPSIQLDYSDHWTKAWFQWSNFATADGELPLDCESPVLQTALEYKVYVLFMDQKNLHADHFFSSVQKMLTPGQVSSNGFEVFSVTDGPNAVSQVKVISRSGQGAVYGVVVTRKDLGTNAAYITSVTYACDLKSGNCSVESTALEIVVAVVAGFLGAFLLLLGHRYFKISQLVFAFSFFCLLTYILMSVPHTASEAVKLAVSACVGIVGACLWLGLWYLLALPILSVFLVGLCAGYLVSATLFFTPFGNLDWWSTELNYSMSFTCVLLLFTVVLMAYSKVLNILSCGIVGAFLLLMVATIPLRSSLLLVFLNSVHRQTISGLVDAKTAVPYHTQDIILFTAWPLLTIVGAVFQTYRERNREPFPIPPRIVRKRQQMWQSARYLVEEDDGEGEGYRRDGASSDTADERRPLITNTSPEAYESIHKTGARRTGREREITNSPDSVSPLLQ
ncbi:transmembrane 7 superfamily member 3 isoform X2 [Aplysia californica]|nr:transmembrane 7 superfamily member 3 isoform X2 [Aplysia californica]